MHIPDNFLSTPVWATLDVIAAPAVVIVSRNAQKSTESNRLPLLGVMGAFVFAAQMINFPVGIGTSGHLVGGTLLACVLGPWAAALVVTAILIIQAFVFQDGGILALGANIINMALIGVMVGYLPARAFLRSKWKAYGVFAGGTFSVLASGILALAELLISGIRIPSTLIAISLGLFAVNAVIEGAITVSVLGAIHRLNPETADVDPKPAKSSYRSAWQSVIPAFLAASVVLAAVGIILASALPDGLERLAAKLGIPFGAYPFIRSPLSNYQFQMFGTTWFSRAGAGLFGLVLVYLLCAVGGHLVSRGRRSFS